MQQIFSQELRFKNDDGTDFDDWDEKSLGYKNCRAVSSVG
ncbi:hypothetical protein EMA8858_02317 [Emticicia aquatica]|uniref:Uncharacterized protein n=1 Tax=Emticicia aquatica TaxID=1681835 RepID=A0ABM9ASA1_9BACT|nr:hypothetical protein EMA8858_02317 [Emticicia aquatica]